jgi:DNA-binding beta-propeller fold protein YncE
VSVVDGSSGKTVDRVKSGRDTKRVAKLATAAGAQVAMTGLVVATGPSYTVNGTSYYNVPIVNPVGYGSENQTTFGNFSETADFLYVYNAWTDDVTVIDTVSHKIVKKLPGGEDGLMTVDDGKLLCTISGTHVRLFDIGNGFEMKAKYDGIFSEVLEIPGKSKLYLTQELRRSVAVVDLDTLGDFVTIPGTSGKVIRPMGYE